MGKIIIGCWDCQYCGTTRISGEIRECPNCGRARDKDVRFYMADPENYAKDQDAASREADWLCPYCDCLNPAAATTCSSCGALRDGSTQDYFQNKDKQEKEQKEAASQNVEASAPKPQMSTVSKAPGSRTRTFIILAVIAAVIALIIFLLLPKKKGIEIVSTNWERSVEVQIYTEFEENGWDLPQGAYNVTSREEIYGHEKVLDHYETRTRQVAEQVLDGYDTNITYNDLGNGRFEQIENQVPRYRTEYRTETYEEPIYRDEPVYATRYYYLIMRWVTDHYETTSGENDEPYFADVPVSSTCREGMKTEAYWIVDTKGDTYTVDYNIWKDLEAGQKINAKVQFGHITELVS